MRSKYEIVAMGEVSFLDKWTGPNGHEADTRVNKWNGRIEAK